MIYSVFSSRFVCKSIVDEENDEDDWPSVMMVLSDGIALIDDLTIRLHNCIGLLEEIVIETEVGVIVVTWVDRIATPR